MSALSDLNEQQRLAAETTEGPVVIVAGPGTGKTKTLAARIAHLLEKGVAPQHILALTFTVKAAAEMRERVVALAGVVPTISTFHALGYKILQESDSGLKAVFVQEADRNQLIRSLPRPRSLGTMTVRELALAISRYKGAVNPDESAELHRLVEEYQQAMKQKGMLDYDDLLFRARQVLADDVDVRRTWQGRYRYILIDEFQDTSELQWHIIQQIRGNENIFVIGDPKQSIYGFRGVSADMFAGFRRDFPACREITLHTNYRSAKAVVALASAIFGGKDALVAHSADEGQVRAVQTLNEYSEADYVLQQIEEGIGGSDLLKVGAGAGKSSFRDFAVLYRTHQSAKTVAARLHDSGIPFQVVGEGSPYDQPEVQAVIGLLGCLAGGEAPAIKGFSSGQVKVLVEKIDPRLPVSKLALACADAFELAATEQKRGRLQQLVSTLVRFDGQEDGLPRCLEYIRQISDGDFYDAQMDAVTLLTIHAAKGLEFTHVILIAAEEGTLPHIRKTAPTDFNEERRLFYVAATRAKQQLDIMYARIRSKEARTPSRYIDELGHGVLPRVVDPAMGALEKKLHRREQKARQGTLF